jgi:Mrp family chromosome partitioning ATPase/uncharacterized protein involved in exopolysaccharide biosynthesis
MVGERLGGDDLGAVAMAHATEVDVTIAHPIAAPADPYAMVRQALRGRYVPFVLLIIVGSAAGAIAGWKLGKPLFRGEAEVRVAYATPQVTGNSDVSNWAGPFDMIMRGEEQNVSSRPVVQTALRDPAWKASLRAATTFDVRRFQSQLAVQRVGGSDHLQVTFTDYDPATAAAGANAAVRSYMNDFQLKGAQVEADRGKNLSQLVGELQGRISTISSQIKAISQEFGVADVESLYDVTERRVSLLEAKTVDVQMVSSAVGTRLVGVRQGSVEEGTTSDRAGATAGGGQLTPPLQAATPAEIAASGNELMRQYLADLDRIQVELEDATSIRRLGEAHPEVKRLTKLQQKARERVAVYANEYNKTQTLLARYPEALVRQNPGAWAGRTAEAIRDDLNLVTRLRDDAKETLLALAPKRQEVQELKAQAGQLRLELARLKGRQDMLQVESLPNHRIEVVELADVPAVPFKDVRKQYAVAGVVGGGGLPAALVILFGLLNRRFRFSDEAETRLATSAPLLGILPSLPQRMTDPEQAAGAAQCVHQIRVLLQVGGGGRQRRRRGVYLMTSTTPGEGKTSLTVSLGLSFAAAGSRTLVMDCDLVAQRITRGFNLAGQAGLRDALAAGTVRGFAKKTASGLWVTPVGTADVLDACAVSSTDIHRLLNDARRYFDTIIIDSGPILGSVEATTIAAQTDGVIFVVARGQEPRLVEKALKHLDSLGAPIAGFVFNRAERKDFSRSAHASSLRSIPSSSIPTRSLVTDSGACGAFGPLVQSVVSLVPSARQFAEPHPDSPQQERSAASESRIETVVGA